MTTTRQASAFPNLDADRILDVRNLVSGYGKKKVLNGVSLTVRTGEIVALLGPNGAGKSTVLKIIAGLVESWKGEVLLDGMTVLGTPPAHRIRRGISYIAQGGRVFSELTVRENLLLGGHVLKDRRKLAERYEETIGIFPVLADACNRTASSLSGGERQILAFGQAMMLKPKLLVVDEPSIGLSPAHIRRMFDVIRRMNQQNGASVLLVEQNVGEALSLANRVYVLRLGHIVLESRSSELSHQDLRKVFIS